MPKIICKDEQYEDCLAILIIISFIGEAFKTKFSIECYSWIDRSESEDPCGQESESRRRRSTQNSPGIKFQYFYKRVCLNINTSQMMK